MGHEGEHEVRRRVFPPTLRPLLILDSPEINGPAKGILQILAAMAEEGIEALVVNFRYPNRPSAVMHEVRALGHVALELEQRSRADWRILREVTQARRRHNSNVVQSHGFKADVVAFVLCRRSRRSWIAFAHGYTQDRRRSYLYNRIDQILLRYPGHVCAVADPVAESLRRAGRTTPITIIANAIDCPFRSPNVEERGEFRLKLGLAPQQFVIAYIGRLSKEKGVDILLGAARTFVRENDDACILIAGDGPESSALARAVSLPPLVGKVHMLGWLQDPRPLMAAANLVVIPSRSEGLPNVALESYSVGTPVLATHVGALPDVIDDGQTGWVIPPGDMTALLNGIRRAASALENLPAYGIAGRERILEKFSIDRRMKALGAVYAAVLKE